MVRGETAKAFEELRAEATRVAEQLVEFETSGELALLRDATALRGRSAEIAAEAVQAAVDLWAKYPLLQSTLEELEREIDQRDHAGATPLLTKGRELVAEITADLARAEAMVGDVAHRWRDILPRIDAFRAEIDELQSIATDLEMVDDPDLQQASRMAEHLMATIAADPLGTDTLPTERALERARTRLQKLHRARLHLPSDLADAAHTLDELSQTVTEGRAALADVRAKITGRYSYIEPLTPGVLDDGDRALRPWLGRLVALADAGNWRPAATGLEQWRVVADGLLANARLIVETNRAPIETRDELRGLLEAYRAKAAALGQAEDNALANAAAAARNALYTAPCDLDVAADLVQRYVDAVNAAIARSR